MQCLVSSFLRRFDKRARASFAGAPHIGLRPTVRNSKGDLLACHLLADNVSVLDLDLRLSGS